MSLSLPPQQASPSWPALVVVVLAHGLLFVWLWQIRSPQHADTGGPLVFARLIADTASVARDSLPAPRLSSRPELPHQVTPAVPVPAQSDAIAAEISIAPPSSAAVASEPPAVAAASTASEPVHLAELRVACPLRPPPAYPAVSRRLHETGRVVLRVELDESGRITSTRVDTSSGFARLDNAALDAVRDWRCNAPQRDGRPVSAVALQPFNFSLD